MKIIRIPEPGTWRADANTLFHFGDYRVPLDMSEQLAQRAIDEGVAVLVTAPLQTKPASPQGLETKPARAGVRRHKSEPHT